LTNRQALPGSKWFKYLVMKDAEDLHPYLPDTDVYTEENLWKYLHHYPIVFIKPDIGYGGRKVFRVLHDDKGGYQVRMEQHAQRVHSERELHSWVERVRKGRRFIIQEGIKLDYWGGRPVDIRTIVQINADDEWEVTGMFCKMAGRRLAVTNVCIGGSAHSVEDYLKALGYRRHQRARLVEELIEMSLALVKPFADTYSNAIYGLDIGLDTRGDLFVIELNTNPRIGIFRELQLHDMYRRARQLFRMNKTFARKEYLRDMPMVGEEQELPEAEAVLDRDAEAATMEQEFEETAAEQGELTIAAANATAEGTKAVEKTVDG
jgi:YheC/D like ATP-grasp